MVANYVPDEKRSGKEKHRFDSYADEVIAIEAAGKLARRLSEREVLQFFATAGISRVSK